MVVLYFIRKNLDLRQGGLDFKQGGLDFRQGGLDFSRALLISGRAVSISSRLEHNKIGDKRGPKPTAARDVEPRSEKDAISKKTF